MLNFNKTVGVRRDHALIATTYSFTFYVWQYYLGAYRHVVTLEVPAPYATDS